jgi:hypothetical protein
MMTGCGLNDWGLISIVTGCGIHDWGLISIVAGCGLDDRNLISSRDRIVLFTISFAASYPTSIVGSIWSWPWARSGS